jgi:hypothetical protein
MVVQDPQALMRLVLAAGQMLQDNSSEPVRLLVCSGWSGRQQGATAAAAAGTAADSSAANSRACRQQEGEEGGSGRAAGAVTAGAPAGCCPEVFFASEVPHEWLFPR